MMKKIILLLLLSFPVSFLAQVQKIKVKKDSIPVCDTINFVGQWKYVDLIKRNIVTLDSFKVKNMLIKMPEDISTEFDDKGRYITKEDGDESDKGIYKVDQLEKALYEYSDNKKKLPERYKVTYYDCYNFLIARPIEKDTITYYYKRIR
jgi:hypothetical protein